jgi:ABC-type bacteriocin/lantibiotic exporter with double-glycine peptidase domain
MVLSFFGVARTEAEVMKECDTTELGTVTVKLSTAAYKFGLKSSSLKNANIDELKNELRKGRPVIVLIDPSYLYGGVSGFGHFIVIVGFSDEEIIYHDPDVPEGEYMRINNAAFQNSWESTRCWMISMEKE